MAYGRRAHTVCHGGTGLVAGLRGRQLVTGSQEAGSRQEVGLGYKTSRFSLQFALPSKSPTSSAGHAPLRLGVENSNR